MVIAINGILLYSRLVGLFNAYNVTAVFAAASLLDVKQDHLVSELGLLEPVEGRMQKVEGPENMTGIIDFAHTPDALQKVLATIKSLMSPGQAILTVVGCGGERDREKRPVMARVAVEYSDHVILTSDNPRSEPPNAIIDDMYTGVVGGQRDKISSIADRRKAIAAACVSATPGSVLLVAGKGHEKYQEIDGQFRPFDDVTVVKECFEERRRLRDRFQGSQ